MPGRLPHIKNVDRVVDEDTRLVAFAVVRQRIIRDTQERVAQADREVLGRAALNHVGQLTEDLAFGAIAASRRAVVDIVAAYISRFVAQTRPDRSTP